MQRNDFHTQLLKPGMKSVHAFSLQKTIGNVFDELKNNQTRPPERTA